MSLFKRLGKESVVYGLGSLLGRSITFLLLPLYTRVFTPAEYGIIDIISTMIVLASTVLTAGSETSLAYYFFKDESKESRRETVATTAAYLFGVYGCLAAAVWLFSPTISRLAFGSNSYATALRLAALSLVAGGTYTLTLTVIRLQRRPWAYSSLSVAYVLASVLLNLLFVVGLRMGVRGVFLTNVIASSVFAGVGLWTIREVVGTAASWTRLRMLLVLGAPLIISGISEWITSYLDRAFLLRYTTLSEIGRYSLGSKFGAMAAFAMIAFRTANAPFQLEIAKSPDARTIFARSLSYFVYAGCVLCLALSVFARPLLAVMTTQDYVDVYPIVTLTALSAFAYGVYQLVGIGLLLSERTAFAGGAQAAGAAISFGLLAVLVPRWGIVGAATAGLASHVCVVGMLLAGAQRAYPIPYEFGRIARILGLTTIFLAVRFWLPSPGIATDCAFGLTLLTAFLVLTVPLRLIGSRERQFVRERVSALIRSTWRAEA